MCGITGWVVSRGTWRASATIDAMTQMMACRGPDASGVWLERHAALGHRRLAVIDLPGGAQPMSVSTPSGDVVMVYSGEAYNFTELRDELAAKGEQFRTSSDTEVVLRGYLRWGEALAERLNGMHRVCDLGFTRTKARDDPRPDGHQAVLLLSNARRRVVRFGAQGDPGQPNRQAHGRCGGYA